MNTVASLDGKVSRDGKSKGIGGEADWRAMRNLRAASDAVIIGAGSLRAERMSLDVPEAMAKERRRAGKPPQPLAVIVGGLRGLPIRENLIGHSPDNTLIILPETAGEEHADPASKLGAVEYLRRETGLRGALSSLYTDHGVEFALVEGGPSLSWSLISDNLVDEIFLTISPKLLGGPSPSFIEGNPLPETIRDAAHLVSAHLSAGDLFLQYRLRAP